MKNLKLAIVMSDLHLGRNSSYLFSEHENYKENRDSFTEFLSRFPKPDELILNGDIFELSLEGWDIVCREVKNFLEIIANVWIPDRIVYIPGNHDHHIWRELAEQIYVYDNINQGKSPPSKMDFIYYFVDKRFTTRSDISKDRILLKALWPSTKRIPEFIVKYPNHLISTGNNNTKQYYLITHGHFLERLFRPVNYIIDPARMAELEAFNNIWLEAFDYHLGHAGRLSKTVVKLLECYEKGGEKVKKDVNKILNQIYINVKQKLHLCELKSFLLKIGMKLLVRNITIENQSGLFKSPLDDVLLNDIQEYINKYIVKRYQIENFERLHLPSKKSIPVPFTFVFGHTHRPLKRDIEVENAKVTINDFTFPIQNTGGWLRSDGPIGNGENAGVLVIDETGSRWEALEGRLK